MRLLTHLAEHDLGTPPAGPGDRVTTLCGKSFRMSKRGRSVLRLHCSKCAVKALTESNRYISELADLLDRMHDIDQVLKRPGPAATSYAEVRS